MFLYNICFRICLLLFRLHIIDQKRSKFKKEEEMTYEEKNDTVKPSKEEQEVQTNITPIVLFVLVAIFAIIFALFLGYIQ